MPTKLGKFTALSPEKISEIVANLPDNLNIFARLADDAIKFNLSYAELIRQYNKIRAENGDAASFINENQGQIKAFLNDCGLIGFVDEKQFPSDYTIGADGVAIIATYLACKPINRNAHHVHVIKNATLQTAKGSRKHSKIFLETKK